VAAAKLGRLSARLCRWWRPSPAHPILSVPWRPFLETPVLAPRGNFR
jgi:hypothetical protein